MIGDRWFVLEFLCKITNSHRNDNLYGSLSWMKLFCWTLLCSRWMHFGIHWDVMITLSYKWPGRIKKIGQKWLNFELVLFSIWLKKGSLKVFHIWILHQKKQAMYIMVHSLSFLVSVLLSIVHCAHLPLWSSLNPIISNTKFCASILSSNENALKISLRAAFINHVKKDTQFDEMDHLDLCCRSFYKCDSYKSI